MARDYTAFFDRVKLYASMFRNGITFRTQIETSQLHQAEVLKDSVADNALFKALHTQDVSYTNQTLAKDSSYTALLSGYLIADGKNEIISSGSTAASVAADVKTFMTADSETVLTNILGNSVTYDRSGDGVVSTLTQSQLTRNDTITLTCTTAQVFGSVDAIFSVRSLLSGARSGTVTADGATSFADTKLGIASLIVDAGSSAPNIWVLNDIITISTTSDDRSILVNIFRDKYDVELPTAGTPTITNTLSDVVSAFPGTPVDGQEVVLDGILYRYSTNDTAWIEVCVSS